jgi:histone H3/H4
MTDLNSENEILVVTSKLKKYIRSVSGMSTSANVLPKLSDTIRSLCNQAIEKAKADGRKTVMDRDFT